MIHIKIGSSFYVQISLELQSIITA